MAQTTPYLSVIVPVYNQEEFLRKCLDSIIGQTYADMEIICVNDGSTDSSQTILEEYAAKDPRIRIVVKENGGLSSARNAGMDVMRGTVVAFVDSDDWIDPRTFELTVPHMRDYDYVQFNVYDVRRGELSSWDLPSEGPTVLTFDINSAVRPSVWNKLYKTELLRKYGLRFPEGLNNEDCMFSYAYRALVSEGYFLNDRLYYYVEHDKSITADIHKRPGRKNLDQIKIIVPLTEFFRKHDLLDDNADRILSMMVDYTWFVFNTMYARQKPMVIRASLSVARQIDIIDIVRRSGRKLGWGTLFKYGISRIRSKI